MTPHLVRFNGDEFEAMTKGGRRVHRFRPGNRAQIKRRFRRRERRVADDELRDAAGSPHDHFLSPQEEEFNGI